MKYSETCLKAPPTINTPLLYQHHLNMSQNDYNHKLYTFRVRPRLLQVTCILPELINTMYALPL